MKSTRTKKQVIDGILSESKGCYGKLLSPFRVNFNYSPEDLISYIFTAIDMLEGVKSQLQELMKRKSTLNMKYAEKSKHTFNSIDSTIAKLNILKSKALRLQSKTYEQNSSDYCYDVASDFSQQKVVEIDMLTHEDNDTKINDIKDCQKIIGDEAIEESKKSDLACSEDIIDSLTPSFDSLLVSEIFNSESLLENNLKIGINPTALCTEIEEALSRLLANTNNYDYCEFFYRADFLHVYESSIHEIIKMPDDDVFYYSDLSNDKVVKFNNAVTTIYPEYRESFMVRYRYFCYMIEMGFALLSKTLNRENHIIKALKFLWYAPLYLFSHKRRQSQFKSFICSEDLSLMMKIAKASGNSLSKFAFYFINPRIKFHKKIYIPRNYEKLTIDNLNESLSEFINKKSISKLANGKLKRKLRTSESFCEEVHHKLTVKTQSFYYKNKRELILLRIASPFKMSLNSTGLNSQVPPIECEAVLIHIHGGGFVSQSTSQHQI